MERGKEEEEGREGTSNFLHIYMLMRDKEST